MLYQQKRPSYLKKDQVKVLEELGFLLRPPTRPPLRLMVLVSESSILRPAAASAAGETFDLALLDGARFVQVPRLVPRSVMSTHIR